MEGPCRSSGSRQSRRSRSQRDRERRRRRSGLGETRAYSPSSGSELEGAAGPGAGPGGLGLGGEDSRPAAHNNRPRPPRRRKRESVSSEEDLIDCFAIASFISLEALEDSVQKPSERAQLWERRSGKRKRPEENGPGSDLGERRGGGSTDRERERANGMGEPDRRAKRRRRRRRREGSGPAFLENGYICDTESDSDDKASESELDHSFTVSTSRIPEMAGNGLTPHDLAPRLSVTPRVSGIQRSQERNREADGRLPKEPPGLPLSRRLHPSSPSLPKEARRGGDKPSPSPNYHGGQTQVRTPTHPPSNPSQGSRSTPQPRSHGKGLLQHPFSAGLGFNNSRSSTPSKTPTSSSSSSSNQLSLHRPSTPSGLALSLNPPFPGGLRPPSHPGGGLFAPSPGLPPPPPLLQVAGHATSAAAASVFSEQDLIRQELNSRFLTSQSGGGGGAERAGGGAGGEGRGPAAPAAGPPGSGTASGPLAFQYHQHNHQHQHTHTHQHYTPFLPPSAAATAVVQNTPASPMFDKYPGKVDGLYRHNFYPTYPPSVSGLPPVLPPAGTFSSLQGAFQPKTTNQEIAARLGAVPHPLQQKDPRLTDPFRAALRVSNKPGKWCAMHVRVAWMILRHQEKVKHMQADPHKPDFRNDLLTRVPGSGSVGPLSSAHDLSRPSTLFSASGAVHHGSSPFAPPAGPLNSFLNPPSHLVSDPFGRSPTYTPLGSLGNAAFGGLGSPNITPSSMFAHKDVSGGSQGFSNPHDPWNRLHRAPASFPTAPTWPKGGDAERGGSSSSSVDRERERERENEKRVIKDEKERDGVYGRHPVRRSPVTPNQKCAPPTSTPPCSSAVSHSNGHAVAEEEKRGGGGGGRDSREHSRDRDRERLKIKEQQQKNPNTLQNDSRHLPQSGQPRPALPDNPENSGPAIPTSSSFSNATSSPVSVKEHVGLLGREGGGKLSSSANPLPLSSSSSSSSSAPAPVNSVRENGGRPDPPTSVGPAGEKEREKNRDHKSPKDQSLDPKKAETCPVANATTTPTPPPPPPPPPPTPPPSLLPIPLIKVKEERKEEPIPVPPSHPPPPAPTPPSLAPLSFDRPSSRGTLLSSHPLPLSQLHPSLHPLPNQGTNPSLGSNHNPSIAAAMGLKFSPVLAHHHPAAAASSSASSSTSSHPLSSLSMLERTRALGAAYLGGQVLARPSHHHHHHHHHSPHQYPHSATSFSWSLQEVMQQQQQQQQLAHQAHQRREMVLRDPQIARFFAAAAQQRFYEQERVGYVRDEFGGLVVDRHPHSLPAHHHHHHPLHPLHHPHHHHHHERVGGAPGSSSSSSSASSSAILNTAALLEENERAQILREDFERARFYGVQAVTALGSPHHPHPHLQTPSLFTRLAPGTLYSHPHHHPHQNGLLSKTPPSMVGPPPPLIPSGGAGNGAGPPRSGGGSPRDSRCTPLPGEERGGGLYSSQKGRDSR